MVNKHRLVLGGARSGKSAYAEGKILQISNRPAYLATGQSFDAEMDTRVRQHQASRAACFTTYECPLNLEQSIIEAAHSHDAILIDCLTLWVSNLMMAEDSGIEARGKALVTAALSVQIPIIFVSNEVGLGIVPDNAMARQFRDHAGRLHQNLGEACADVTFVVAGLPMAFKGNI